MKMPDTDWKRVMKEQASEDPLWVYSYCVWPDGREGFSEATFEVFRGLPTYEEVFTEAGWKKFVDGLFVDGFTVRESSRVPYHEPEIVYTP